jgi:hypothetical protein
MNYDQHRNLASLISGLGKFLAPASLGKDITLSQLWSTSYRVIAFYADDRTVAEQSFLWPQSAISSPWPNTSDIQTLHDTLEKELPNKQTTFFVLQGILTADMATIAKGVSSYTGAPDSLISQAKMLNPELVQWLASWKGQGINIVICDFPNYSIDYVDTVVKLNS